jgi:L-threonylcarbamoyladenylate synthase
MEKTTSIDAAQLARAAELIRAGKLVAFPTETVYGLGANALDADAVARIFLAKGRPTTSPLIVHVSSVEMARGLTTEFSAYAEKLAAAFWPGPLTLVLPKDERIPDIVTAGLKTVGLRVPAHPVALALIREAGVPIAAPSANRFTELSPTRAEHVPAGLAEMVLDGGPTSVGIESTVLSLAGGRAVLLRPGMVSQAAIEAVIGPIEVASMPAGSEAHASPGMHHKHYSPRTPVRIGRPRAGKRCAYLFVGEALESAHAIMMPDDAGQYAAILYDTLHFLDGEGLDEIVVEPLPGGVEWMGIRDRIERAAVD